MNTEKVVTIYMIDGHYTYQITQNCNNGIYKLYKFIENMWIYTRHKAANPHDLELYIQ